MVTWLQRYGRNFDGNQAQTVTTDPPLPRHGEDMPSAAGPAQTASVSRGSKPLTAADLTEASKTPKEGQVKERRGRPRQEWGHRPAGSEASAHRSRDSPARCPHSLLGRHRPPATFSRLQCLFILLSAVPFCTFERIYQLCF